MDPKNIIQLYQFNQWANKRVLDACATLTDEQFTRGMGNSFPSIRDTMAHMFGAEFAWYERLFGRSPAKLLSGDDFPTLAPLLKKFEEHDARLLEYVSNLSAADLDKVLEYKNLVGKEFSNPLWQIFQHLANHGTYHRGQVTTMFRQLGVKPVSTDLIGFYREQAELAKS